MSASLPVHFVRSIGVGAGGAGLSLALFVALGLPYAIAVDKLKPDSSRGQDAALFVFTAIAAASFVLLPAVTWLLARHLRASTLIALFVAFMIVGFFMYPLAHTASFVNDCNLGRSYPLRIAGCD